MWAHKEALFTELSCFSRFSYVCSSFCLWQCLGYYISLFSAFTLQSHPSFEMCFIVILASWYSFEEGTLVPNWRCLVFPMTRITCVTFMKDKFLPAFNVWTCLATAAQCIITSGWQSHAKILPNLFILTVLTVRHISLMCCLQITPLLSPRGQICN